MNISAPGMVDALLRLREFRKLGVGHVPLTRMPVGRVKTLARYAAAAKAKAIARMPFNRRIASLLAFAVVYQTSALDDARLRDAVRFLLDTNQPELGLREVIFETISREQLEKDVRRSTTSAAVRARHAILINSSAITAKCGASSRCCWRRSNFAATYLRTRY
jgi:hypothetical protein